MKKGKHLSFYIRCIKTGRLPNDWWGLCGCSVVGLISESLLDLFEPTEKDKAKMHSDHSRVYWGGPYCVFTPLRQNIVLLMAAINNEL